MGYIDQNFARQQNGEGTHVSQQSFWLGRMCPSSLEVNGV